MSEEFKSGMVELLPRLRRFALARTGNVHAADDLVQATCERAWKSRHQLAPGSRMDSWMYKIMINQQIDDVRASAARGHQADPEVLDTLPDDRWSRRIESSLTLERVAEVMRQMPATLREVLTLVSIDGLSYRETANVLDVPIGTIMSRLARARASLMENLEIEGSMTGWEQR